MHGRPRPFLVAILIGLAAEALFLWGVTIPSKIVFDEIHYVPAARALLADTSGVIGKGRKSNNTAKAKSDGRKRSA